MQHIAEVIDQGSDLFLSEPGRDYDVAIFVDSEIETVFDGYECDFLVLADDPELLPDHDFGRANLFDMLFDMRGGVRGASLATV